ncbi:uncharacterized protein [Elaeis guineensis]|uniref:uncharacterized protein n=1 Tax=Elaeis guineensis var. tenera TaxID=51953 RepID=UPI003C6CD4E9
MTSVEGSMPSMDDSSNTSSTQITRVRGKSDPAWNHCREAPELSGNTKRMKLACLYYGKSFAGGGINRFKQYLAGVKGEVEPCRKVPADIRHQIIQNIQAISEKKKRTKKMGEDYNLFSARHKKHEEQVYYRQLGEDDGIQEISPSSNKSTVAKWMIDVCVPFNAVNSKYYQCMIDAIASMGPGYKAPNFYSVRGYLLTKNVDEVKKYVESFRATWKKIGCTIMADGWTDQYKRTLINFLVYCPRGIVFLKSVDASDTSKIADMLYKLFKEIVMSVGFENVVHVVTDNAANYVAAGKKLEQDFPILFWSPCAAHCLNLIMQDIGKLVSVKNTVAHAAGITKYIYNHCYPLYLMRKFTDGKEIIRPAPTRFATNFIALQSILGHKDALRAMVTSREWTTSVYAKDSKGKKLTDDMLNSLFWNECATIVKLIEPLIRVLRIVDSDDRPSMGYLYHAMHQARDEMIKRFRRRKIVVEPYLRIVDSQWDFISGLLDVIERYSFGNPTLQGNLTNEMRLFRNAENDFGCSSAINDRSRLAPDILNLKDLDGDDGENDGNGANRREDGGDENVATQEDVFANIDINFSPLA